MNAKNQEEAYWAKHERDLENYNLPNPPPQLNQTPPAAPAAPANPVPQNPARAVQRASLQQQNDGGFGDGLDSAGMMRVRPEDLAELLSVSSSGGSNSGGMSQGLGSAGGRAHLEEGSDSSVLIPTKTARSASALPV